MPDRIRARMRELGYWKADRPDVTRFCLEKGYVPSYVYVWLKGSLPVYESLRRLAKDLDCPLPWLLLGEEGVAGLQPKPEGYTAPKDSGRIHARARAVGRPRVRGLRGPLPVAEELGQVVSYRTLNIHPISPITARGAWRGRRL